MRINATLVAQLIEDPFVSAKIVIVSEEDGNEVTLDRDAVDNLKKAFDYFYPHL